MINGPFSTGSMATARSSAYSFLCLNGIAVTADGARAGAPGGGPDSTAMLQLTPPPRHSHVTPALSEYITETYDRFGGVGSYPLVEMRNLVTFRKSTYTDPRFAFSSFPRSSGGRYPPPAIGRRFTTKLEPAFALHDVDARHNARTAAFTTRIVLIPSLRHSSLSQNDVHRKHITMPVI